MLYGLVGQSNYAAAKGGIIALTRALSVELGRYGIRVNALDPVALTDMTAPVLKLSSGDDGGALRSVFGDPADVARIVVALASPSATGITGQIVAFDGTELAVWTHPIRVIGFVTPHRGAPPTWQPASPRCTGVLPSFIPTPSGSRRALHCAARVSDGGEQATAGNCRRVGRQGAVALRTDAACR